MQFRLLGIPVHVSSAFWIIALLISARHETMALVAATMAVVFVAVLVHELGHALVARAFGAAPAIVLHSFGGTTSIQGVRLPRGRNLLVTAAGPFAGFALGALVVLVNRLLPSTDAFWVEMYKQTLFVTFGWGVLNLLPVLPMDGGLILRDLLGPRLRTLAYGISALIGLALAVYCLKAKLIFGTVIFALGTYHSIRALMGHEQAERDETVRDEETVLQLGQAEDSLAAGRLDEAAARASVVLQVSGDPVVRDRARRVIGWVAVHREDSPAALESLRSIERPDIADDVLRAQALDVAGQRDAAFVLLERRTHDHPEGPTLEPLLRGLAAVGRYPDLADLARKHGPVAAPGALDFAGEALHEQALYEEAGGVRALLFDRVGTGRIACEGARSFAKAGEPSRALALLEQAVELGYAGVRDALSSRDLDSLRDDPRFLALEARLPA